MRCLELFAGIGGFASVAAERGWEVRLAVDISQPAAETYRQNFAHQYLVAELESLPLATLAAAAADLWWMSPPCQPFTRRGKHLGLRDPRCRALLACAAALTEIRPRALVLENVPGFAGSSAARHLKQVLQANGYGWREVRLCPSHWGVPNRRDRYYLLASREGVPDAPRVCRQRRTLGEIVLQEVGDQWNVEPTWDRYRSAMHRVCASDPAAVTSCFTSAYGKSPVRSGSYLESSEGLRRFTPREILRLLGFDDGYQLPPGLAPRTAWKLIGNSLSLHAVRQILPVMA